MPRPLLGRATREAFRTLLDAAALQPEGEEQTALVLVATDHPARVLTRRELRHGVQARAAGLWRLGVRPGDTVVFAHLGELDTVCAFWGALVLGAVPSVFPTLTEKLDRGLYLESVAQMARQSNVTALVTADTFAPQLRPLVQCPVLSAGELEGQGADAPAYAPTPGAVAFLQHSSGTTGLQKGVALSHEAVLNQLASCGDALGLRPDDVVVSWLPLYHDMGLIAGFLLPMVQGLPLVLMSPFDWVAHPALLLRALHEHAGTLVWLPNFAYHHCARRIRKRDSAGLDLSRVRSFINCSEPVHAESHALFLGRFAENGVHEGQLAVSYAMAENTFAVTQTPPGRPPRLDHVTLAASPSRTAVSCGTPVAGTEVRVADEEGRPLAEREVGELLVRGDCLFAGYHGRPDLDRQAFREGWYRTGDMGYLAEGEVYVVGRKKDLIINGGKNVYPQDLEAIVNTVAGVHPGRAVAFGVYDEREGTEVVAVVAEVDETDPGRRHEIEQAVRQRLAQGASVTASHVTLVDDRWLIKTSSGKVARS
ncbi:MAG TPA: AMP-binding protein, partial [Vicinamibacteria bacterium]